MFTPCLYASSNFLFSQLPYSCKWDHAIQDGSLQEIFDFRRKESINLQQVPQIRDSIHNESTTYLVSGLIFLQLDSVSRLSLVSNPLKAAARLIFLKHTSEYGHHFLKKQFQKSKNPALATVAFILLNFSV